MTSTTKKTIYDLSNHDNEKRCLICGGTGFYKYKPGGEDKCTQCGLREPSLKRAIICKECKRHSPYTLNGLCYSCDPENMNELNERKICELSVKEFKSLWIECYEAMERHKLDMSMAEYQRLTVKPIRKEN